MVYEGYTNVMRGVYSFNLGAVISGNRTDGVHFDVDNNGTPYTVYPYFLVVPNKVYGETEQNAVINTMFEIIPIIVIAGIVITVSYWAIGRK